MLSGMFAAVPLAGAAVTMSVTMNGCLATVTTSGLTAEQFGFIFDAPADSPEGPSTIAVVGDGTAEQSTVTVPVWPGTGTLYLYDAFGAFDDGAPVATAEYVADCAAIPFEFTPTETVDLPASNVPGPATQLNFAFRNPTLSYGLCRVTVDEIVDSSVVLTAGTTLSGTCNEDLSTLDDLEFLGAAVGGLNGQPYEDPDATLECTDICRLTAALAAVDDFVGGFDIEGELIIDGLTATFPAPVRTDEITLYATSVDGDAECYFHEYIEPADATGLSAVWTGTTAADPGELVDTLATGLGLGGTVSGWCDAEDPEFDWAGFTTGSLSITAYNAAYDEVEGVINTPGSLSIECSEDPSVCQLRFVSANIAGPPTAPGPSPLVPATPAPAAPKYTG